MTEQFKVVQATTPIPPLNTLRVEAWRDLPSDKSWRSYQVTSAGCEPRIINLRKNNRRILDAAIKQPILCASPVRISDVIHILKRDYGIGFETKMYKNDTETDRAKFGVYFLTDAVTPINEVQE